MGGGGQCKNIQCKKKQNGIIINIKTLYFFTLKAALKYPSLKIPDDPMGVRWPH
jgi:hypothetical protein